MPQHEILNFKAKKIADKLGHKQALRRVAMVARLGKSKRQSAAQKIECSKGQRTGMTIPEWLFLFKYIYIDKMSYNVFE